MARSSGRKSKKKKKKGDQRHVSSNSWRGMEVGEKAQLVRRALASQWQLQAALLNLEKPDVEGSSTWFDEVLESLKDGFEGVQEFFSAFVATELFTERHAAGNAPDQPHRIFGIAELVEHVLSFLSTRDLLTVRHVNRALRDSVEHSEVLQRKLHTRPNKSGYLETPFATGSESSTAAAFVCDSQFPAVTLPPPGFEFLDTAALDTHSVQVWAKCTGISSTGFSVPSSSSPYRSMLVCHPAPTRMNVHPICCSSERQFLTPGLDVERQKVTSPTGITVGDLYDATVEIRREHRLCPYAARYLHDEDGYVRVDVSFRSLLELKPEDPYFGPSLLPDYGPWPPSPDERDEKVEAYIAAKQEGKMGFTEFHKRSSQLTMFLQLMLRGSLYPLSRSSRPSGPRMQILLLYSVRAIGCSTRLFKAS